MGHFWGHIWGPDPTSEMGPLFGTPRNPIFGVNPSQIKSIGPKTRDFEEGPKAPNLVPWPKWGMTGFGPVLGQKGGQIWGSKNGPFWGCQIQGTKVPI